MRKKTRNIVGVISLGVLATSWSLGQAAETGLSLAPGAAANTADTSVNTDSQPAETAVPSDAPSSSATSTPAANASATPTPTATKTPAVTAAAVTKTSSAVSYVAKDRPGVMQISVTKTGSKITDVTIISGGTEGGEWASVPSMLAQAAIQAQGSNFGNITRATHTTDAFKQALESALAKF